MSDRRTAEGIYLAARARSLKWQQQFILNWLGQDIEQTMLMAARTILETTPPEVLAKLDPQKLQVLKDMQEKSKWR